jgi:hypothetical protein
VDEDFHAHHIPIIRSGRIMAHVHVALMLPGPPG